MLTAVVGHVNGTPAAEFAFIAMHQPRMIGVEAFDEEPEAFFFAGMLKERRQFPDQRREIEVGRGQEHPARIDLGEIEDLVNQVQQVIAARGNGRHGDQGSDQG